ncbi:MAG: HAD family hydrolase [Candidatus Promineifilaceae bacterium]|jgi:HAD superfamily hydrolase (TIGR01549 family)
MTISVKAILFDLDDTLLCNDMSGFVSSYVPLIAQFVQPHIDSAFFIDELMLGSQAMVENQDRNLTNAEVFWNLFYARTGLEEVLFMPVIEEFYDSEFSKLQGLTRPVPGAPEIVRYCMDEGYLVVVATNPLFPLSAIKQRLSWAGIPMSEFDYDLVTSYENMHASKPWPDYYEEILRTIGVDPEEAVMIGDDWSNDIEGASAAGLYTYWIDSSTTGESGNIPGLIGQGSLVDFFQLVKNGEIEPVQ